MGSYLLSFFISLNMDIYTFQHKKSNIFDSGILPQTLLSTLLCLSKIQIFLFFNTSGPKGFEQHIVGLYLVKLKMCVS